VQQLVGDVDTNWKACLFSATSKIAAKKGLNLNSNNIVKHLRSMHGTVVKKDQSAIGALVETSKNILVKTLDDTNAGVVAKTQVFLSSTPTTSCRPALAMASSRRTR
jgi:hypothetical protein